MELTVLWFILITVLFTGFFFLEGFDYGVGTLLPLVGRDDRQRGQLLRTIAPVWDGNEVWMITAGGALFAAFPHVYATMFSAFYLALFLMLVALIMRGVAFELRGKLECARWRVFWDGAICFGSAVPAFLWGVTVTNLIAGLPIDAGMHYQGGFFDLLTPYTLVGGLTFLLVFAFHGAAFLCLRLADDTLVMRARQYALRLGSFAALAFLLCFGLTLQNTGLGSKAAAVLVLALAGLCFLLGLYAMSRLSFRSSFICGSLAIVCTTAAFFLGLFPNLMVSSLSPLWSLTIENTSSTEYTLSIMTVAALVLVPIVLIYQGWTYWVFRQRVSFHDADAH